MPDYFVEVLNINNARQHAELTHLVAGSLLAPELMTLVSGVDVRDAEEVNVTLHNNHGTESARFQVFGSNSSGATAPTGSVIIGADWVPVGGGVTVGAGSSDFASFETTDFKFVAVTGSSSAAIASGIDVHLMWRSRH